MKVERRHRSAVFSREKITLDRNGGFIAEVESLPADLLDVGVRYMKELKEKALRVSQALQAAKIPHAVIGGLALAAHIARVDDTAAPNTVDLDILLQRSDLESARKALEPFGYRYRKVMRLHAFMPNVRKPKFADGVHIIWSGEKVRSEYLHAAPKLNPSSFYHAPDGVHYLRLQELLIMKLTSFRLKDQVHVQHLYTMGLITKKIEHALPADLRERLHYIKNITERER
jgi:hypothetical protein